MLGGCRGLQLRRGRWSHGVGGRIELEESRHRGQAQRVVLAQDVGSPFLEASRANRKLEQVVPGRGVLGRQTLRWGKAPPPKLGLQRVDCDDAAREGRCQDVLAPCKEQGKAAYASIIGREGGGLKPRRRTCRVAALHYPFGACPRGGTDRDGEEDRFVLEKRLTNGNLWVGMSCSCVGFRFGGGSSSNGLVRMRVYVQATVKQLGTHGGTAVAIAHVP